MKVLLSSARESAGFTARLPSRIEKFQLPLIVLTAAADGASHAPGISFLNSFALVVAATDRTLLRGRFISPPIL